MYIKPIIYTGGGALVAFTIRGGAPTGVAMLLVIFRNSPLAGPVDGSAMELVAPVPVFTAFLGTATHACPFKGAGRLAARRKRRESKIILRKCTFLLAANAIPPASTLGAGAIA